MTDPSPHLYRLHGGRAAVSSQILDSAIRQSELVLATKSTPVLSLSHLAFQTGVSYSSLRRIVNRSSDPYQELVVSKRNGKKRYISAPKPLLMEVQRWILRECLDSKSNHSSSFAYQKGLSIVDCATRHLGARWLVKFDLHNFFGGIEEDKVFRVFQGQGYSRLVSFELARICTRMTRAARESTSSERDYDVISAYIAPRIGVLPQGAPTSGSIANGVATFLDEALFEVALEAGLIYTRYSDDLTFSASGSFNRIAAKSLIATVRKCVNHSGFQLHNAKTRVIPPGARHVVLGLIVTGESVRLLPEFRRRVEFQIRGVREFGLAHHAHYADFPSLFSLINYVDGCLAFAQEIESGWANDMRDEWTSALQAASPSLVARQQIF